MGELLSSIAEGNREVREVRELLSFWKDLFSVSLDTAKKFGNWVR